MDQTGTPDSASREHLIVVIRALTDLLRECGEHVKAHWIGERSAIIENKSASVEAISIATAELHGIVLGMGGLMDIYLPDSSQEASKVVNRELRRLADQLYELTR